MRRLGFISLLNLISLMSALSEMIPVLVYNGPGVSMLCLEETLHFLECHLTPAPIYDVQCIDAEYLAKTTWKESTKLFVMPGGRDLPYVAALEPNVTDLIRDYVHAGGMYLGLCAGAYFASKRVEFELDRPEYKVVGDRALALVDAVAKGAAFSGFVYGTEQGARAASIQLRNHRDNIPMYFNGGPFFDVINGSNVDIIGKYEDGRAAIVIGTFGKGMAILSGVHLEFNPSTIPATSTIIQQLNESNTARINFIYELKCLMNL